MQLVSIETIEIHFDCKIKLSVCALDRRRARAERDVQKILIEISLLKAKLLSRL